MQMDDEFWELGLLGSDECLVFEFDDGVSQEQVGEFFSLLAHRNGLVLEEERVPLDEGFAPPRCEQCVPYEYSQCGARLSNDLFPNDVCEVDQCPELEYDDQGLQIDEYVMFQLQSWSMFAEVADTHSVECSPPDDEVFEVGEVCRTDKEVYKISFCDPPLENDLVQEFNFLEETVCVALSKSFSSRPRALLVCLCLQGSEFLGLLVNVKEPLLVEHIGSFRPLRGRPVVCALRCRPPPKPPWFWVIPCGSVIVGNDFFLF